MYDQIRQLLARQFAALATAAKPQQDLEVRLHMSVAHSPRTRAVAISRA